MQVTIGPPRVPAEWMRYVVVEKGPPAQDTAVGIPICFCPVPMATQSRGCEVAPLKRVANVTVGIHMVYREDGKNVPALGRGEGG